MTVMEEKPRKNYKVKKVSLSSVFAFEGAEELMSAAQEMYTKDCKLQGNSLWLVEGRYYLVPDEPLMKLKARESLCEYAALQRFTRVQLARIKERGKLLQEGNALEYIGRKILEQSSYI